MKNCLNVTSIGYSHIKNGKPCQDFSASYSDSSRSIITACDGHGGDVYVRSHKGSKFASLAAVRCMLETESLLFTKYTAQEIEQKLKINILCEWNRLVSEDLKRHPLKAREMQGLSESQAEALRSNPVKAYGSTLGAAMTCGHRLVCVGIGDGGMFLLKKDEVIAAFPDDEDEPVANVTYSLCGEDAFEHMHARIFDAHAVGGVLACTDGVLAPYQSMENFRKSFVRPVIHLVAEEKSREVKDFIKKLGAESGIGDDVSLAIMLKTSYNRKFQSRREPLI